MYIDKERVNVSTVQRTDTKGTNNSFWNKPPYAVVFKCFGVRILFNFKVYLVDSHMNKNEISYKYK